MVEILQNKNASTRFQILVEIAARGPSVQQKSIADKLGITPQAVSDYIHQLLNDNLVLSTGRSQYKVSVKGVNWILHVLRELRNYTSVVEQAVTSITVCAAIAESDMEKGQAVSLKMKDGLLYADAHSGGSATGIAVSDAQEGMDVDISNIEGLVEFTKGKVTILQVPAIQKGGSKSINRDALKKLIKENEQLGAIGIEALIAVRRLNIEPRYLYGVADAAVEAGKCGLSFIVICTDDSVPDFIRKLQDESLDYELIDLSLPANG